MGGRRHSVKHFHWGLYTILSRRQVDPSQGILSESLLFIEPLTSSHSLASAAQPGIPSADLVANT